MTALRIVRRHFSGDTQYSSTLAWYSDFGFVVSTFSALRWNGLLPGSVNFDCRTALSATSSRGILPPSLAKAAIPSAHPRITTTTLMDSPSQPEQNNRIAVLWRYWH